MSATFTDDAGDLHTATWDWGDGTTSEGTAIEPDGANPGVVFGSHDYSEAGVYVLTLTLADDPGNVTTQEFRYLVVYDPGDGFVTGGGLIDSPPGAYAPQPALVGRARFGFVSRYSQGASVPAGNTNFELRIADLQFRSTGYEWLIVTGHHAQFTGSGESNGTGNYGFLLTAIDEALTPDTNMDGLRIQIWDKDQGNAIVYDNRMGEDPYGDAVTPVSGGSIAILQE